MAVAGGWGECVGASCGPRQGLLSAIKTPRQGPGHAAPGSASASLGSAVSVGGCDGASGPAPDCRGNPAPDYRGNLAPDCLGTPRAGRLWELVSGRSGNLRGHLLLYRPGFIQEIGPRG